MVARIKTYRLLRGGRAPAAEFQQDNREFRVQQSFFSHDLLTVLNHHQTSALHIVTRGRKSSRPISIFLASISFTEQVDIHRNPLPPPLVTTIGS